ERGGALDQDQQQHADDHHHAGGDGAAREPDPGLAFHAASAFQGPLAHYNLDNLRRRRMRTTSAMVLITNAIRNSSRPPMNSVRYSVPPWGASGISIAMAALRLRKPFSGCRSMTGVPPAAITTIMVSPSARPRPMTMPEKMPLAAAGSTTRMVVCQREAPQARLAARSWLGTLVSASSAMV